MLQGSYGEFSHAKSIDAGPGPKSYGFGPLRTVPKWSFIFLMGVAIFVFFPYLIISFLYVFREVTGTSQDHLGTIQANLGPGPNRKNDIFWEQEPGAGDSFSILA